MSDTNLFGPIVTGDDVERAVVSFLWGEDTDGNRWIDTYLGELERHAGYAPGTIERPKGIVSRTELETWPEDVTPVIVVVSGTLTGRPLQRGGAYEATWPLAISPVVADLDEEQTRKLAHVYTAAIRLAILQHGSLGGFAEASEWIDEGLEVRPIADSRSKMAGRVIFEITVSNVARRDAGPRTALPDPAVDPGPWPTITAREIDVVQVPITEDVHA